MATDYERPTTGRLKKSKYRYLVVGDCLRLPFKDKSIDFVYCKYLIEHIEEIDLFISELQRVGKRGVIIAPSILNENFDNQYFHCWLIKKDWNRLIFKWKQDLVYNKEMYNFINKVITSKDAGLLMLFRLYYHNFFNVTYPWQDEIKYEIVTKPPALLRKEYCSEYHKDEIVKSSLLEQIKWYMYEVITFLFFRRRLK